MLEPANHTQTAGKNSIIGIWEQLNNTDFKPLEFEGIKNQAGLNMLRIKNLNTFFINERLSQKTKLKRLNKIAIQQMKILTGNLTTKRLEGGIVNENSKQISNPSSTGGLGPHFENRVQSAFAVLMLAGGFSPCLPTWPIEKIKLQGKYQGFETDDLIVYCKAPDTGKHTKLIGQIKHSVKITERNKIFFEVIQAAWKDFNNPTVFSAASNDAIALISGPLSATDTNDVRRLLEQARYSENAEDFITRIERATFTSNGQRKKLDVFRTHLKKANNNTDLTKDELLRFLKSFHVLIYDLDIKGVTLSLLHTLINQYSRNNANNILAQINDHVQRISENSGLITVDSLPEEIRAAFKKVPALEIPKEYVTDTTKIVVKNWNNHPNAPELAIANIVGSWNENSDYDKAIISKLARNEYSNWIPKLRDVLQQPESPIVLKNGIWSVKDRKKLWQTLGTRIFDNNLDLFPKCVVKVLTEHDPKFELPKEDRFTAGIHGKILKHSHQLRKGFVETLALIGCCSKSLTNCSLNKAEGTAILSIREIFKEADWQLWASLNDLLPLIAEAAPNEFLKTVEEAFHKKPCPFDNIYTQEGSDITGRNYMTGLLWALETLAWEEEFIVRVFIILGELAERDPGGNSGNRPSSSLSTIILPWHPQTIATLDKRKVAVKTLEKELPDVAWKLLLCLIPKQRQMTMGSRKPTFRESIPKEWNVKISIKEYWKQIYFYSEFAVEKAKDNIDRLNDLITNLDNLPKKALDMLLTYLSSDSIASKPEEIKMGLWTGLVNFTTKHKRYSDAKWALDSNTIKKLDKIAGKLEPTNPLNLYVRLFNGRDFELYEKRGDWQKQRAQIEQRRQKALKIILNVCGIDGVLNFVNRINSPSNVGQSLGEIANDSIDVKILPAFLDYDKIELKLFASAYVLSRHLHKDWDWVDNTIAKEWTKPQIARFCSFLPFTIETWQRVSLILTDKDSLYWQQTFVNPYQTDCDLSFAIDKLVEHGRPHAALECISKDLYDKKTLDIPRTVTVLMSSLSTQEQLQQNDTYKIAEIIKALQNDKAVTSDDLFRVEWAYLPLLNNDHDVTPKYLENRLATDSSFFCEVIRLIYCSKDVPKTDKELTEQEKAIATNAWSLLDKWHVVPGMQKDGSFDAVHFDKWLKKTLNICTETGHVDVALLNIGEILFYSPADPSGLWIHKALAEVLNRKGTEEMRDGYCTATYNSRGVHTVDPTGKPERGLAKKYRKQANAVENAGFQRLAASIRGVADTYDREADRIIDEHKPDDEK